MKKRRMVLAMFAILLLISINYRHILHSLFFESPEKVNSKTIKVMYLCETSPQRTAQIAYKNTKIDMPLPENSHVMDKEASYLTLTTGVGKYVNEAFTPFGWKVDKKDNGLLLTGEYTVLVEITPYTELYSLIKFKVLD